ncbi:MAG TPA: DUF58 domain-containing protein, partial [Methanoculleus sp.]|nr:DUF58 domain-containing protein [Methanoculleus sp.]
LYRAPGPTVLAARARVPRRGRGEEETAYLARLCGALSAFANESPAPFAVAVRTAFSVAEAREIRVYSLLPPGDRSHLIQLAGEAKIRGMRVVLKAPAGTGTLPGVDTVEVI